MIDYRNYILVEKHGYETKSAAYNVILDYYHHLPGIRVYFDCGLWFIVQSKARMKW